MTVLALRLAACSNGVSKLHGAVSRKMWQKVWPGVPENEIPIGSITNGVHFKSWISSEMEQLYDRYLGPRWSEEPATTQPGAKWRTSRRWSCGARTSEARAARRVRPRSPARRSRFDEGLPITKSKRPTRPSIPRH